MDEYVIIKINNQEIKVRKCDLLEIQQQIFKALGAIPFDASKIIVSPLPAELPIQPWWESTPYPAWTGGTGNTFTLPVTTTTIATGTVYTGYAGVSSSSSCTISSTI